jgi:hypothetical protein
MERLKDVNGKDSQKRFWAGRFMWLAFYLAIFYALIWGVATIFYDVNVDFPTFLRDMWFGIAGLGTTKLVTTVFEKPKKT